MSPSELAAIVAFARSSHPWNHRELVASVEGLVGALRLSMRAAEEAKGKGDLWHPLDIERARRKRAEEARNEVNRRIAGGAP